MATLEWEESEDAAGNPVVHADAGIGNQSGPRRYEIDEVRWDGDAIEGCWFASASSPTLGMPSSHHDTIEAAKAACQAHEDARIAST